MSLFNFSLLPLPSWANIITFDVGNTEFTANDHSYYMFVNTNGQNSSIILPSNAEFSKAYVIRKINSDPDILTITTDDVNCFIDGASTSNTDSISVVMGPDGNYWSIGKTVVLTSEQPQTEIQVDISGTADINGFYISFINTNFIPIMVSNTTCITIQYDENTKVIPTSNNLILYF